MCVKIRPPHPDPSLGSRVWRWVEDRAADYMGCGPALASWEFHGWPRKRREASIDNEVHHPRDANPAIRMVSSANPTIWMINKPEPALQERLTKRLVSIVNRAA